MEIIGPMSDELWMRMLVPALADTTIKLDITTKYGHQIGTTSGYVKSLEPKQVIISALCGKETRETEYIYYSNIQRIHIAEDVPD